MIHSCHNPIRYLTGSSDGLAVHDGVMVATVASVSAQKNRAAVVHAARRPMVSPYITGVMGPGAV